MKPIHSFSDGVGRATGPAPTAEVPAPPQHPADAASVLDHELLPPDRFAAADLAGAIITGICATLRERRRLAAKVLDVDSVACGLLPLAALPPVWQVVTVGIVVSLFAAVCLLLMFLPPRRRAAAPIQVPGRLGQKVAEPVCRVPRCFAAEPARDFHSEIRSAPRVGSIAPPTVLTFPPAVRVFHAESEVGDE